MHQVNPDMPDSEHQGRDGKQYVFSIDGKQQKRRDRKRCARHRDSQKDPASHQDQSVHGLMLKSEKISAMQVTSTSPARSKQRRILFSFPA